MATALFENVIFGPIRSRRLGISLGINLLSLDQKLCNFECIYCECGWRGNGRKSFNPKEEVIELLSSKLQQMPTKPPNFPQSARTAGSSVLG
ncbi:MAG: hypothetical protein J6Q35_02235 [Rikenellaceae bacterium]|nr:hypothetical protein [Rikenellaceae bacterium]